eukprot:gnl/TRDRNA2_/TRDRNA2_91566_c0_seq1.p1 gnl/TRDRNA2_/TRDRNA2_91566_c0~~gnl/TRDRNA2_/TRDRNA2_91566_c0_seq1.p1  ORF type:complete len:238 (+),score=30.95 gnl/TRDRNA2_/TRDRNA2_91566_c0_seq1:56-769(+)
MACAEQRYYEAPLAPCDSQQSSIQPIVAPRWLKCGVSFICGCCVACAYVTATSGSAVADISDPSNFVGMNILTYGPSTRLARAPPLQHTAMRALSLPSPWWQQRVQRPLLRPLRVGGPADAFMDLTNLVTSGGKKSAYDDLADELGREVYVDLQGWHLYLRDLKATETLKMHTALAMQLGPQVATNGYDERDVDDLLRKVGVKLGGGKKKLPLADLIPSYPTEDLHKIVRKWADNNR